MKFLNGLVFATLAGVSMTGCGQGTNRAEQNGIESQTDSLFSWLPLGTHKADLMDSLVNPRGTPNCYCVSKIR